jgi:hypothetical protein
MKRSVQSLSFETSMFRRRWRGPGYAVPLSRLVIDERLFNLGPFMPGRQLTQGALRAEKSLDSEFWDGWRAIRIVISYLSSPENREGHVAHSITISRRLSLAVMKD